MSAIHMFVREDGFGQGRTDVRQRTLALVCDLLPVDSGVDSGGAGRIRGRSFGEGHVRLTSPAR